MHVKYVWPFRELPDSNERKTFFWLECTYDEALEVLQEVSLSPRDFRNYVEHLARFRDDGNEHKVFDEGLEVYSRIGFLISEDGNIVEWAPPGFPISNMWNAYNPFKGIRTVEVDCFASFDNLAKKFSAEVPYYSNLLGEVKIAERVNLEAFGEQNPSALLRKIIQTSDLAQTAINVFFERYCEGASIGEFEYFNPDPVVQWELGREYLRLFENISPRNQQAASGEVINFSQIPLPEIYARKQRALMNLHKVEAVFSAEDGPARKSQLQILKSFSDDEVCELALLMEKYPYSTAIKWILGEFEARLFGGENSLASLADDNSDTIDGSDTFGNNGVFYRCLLPDPIKAKSAGSLGQNDEFPDR